MEKFFDFQSREIFLNCKKTKSIKVTVGRESLEKIHAKLILSQKKNGTCDFELSKGQWLKIMKRRKGLIRELENKEKTRKSKKFMQMNSLTVTLRPMDGSRGLVIAKDSGAEFALNKSEFKILVGEKNAVKMEYNGISKKIREKAVAFLSQMDEDLKTQDRYKEKKDIFQCLRKKLRILTMFNNRIF